MEPFVSVVILTTQMPYKVLECLKNQTFQDFEVLIAREEGIVNAMNRALAKAKGEIFVRIDDDVEMPPQWLESLIMPFIMKPRANSPLVAGVTGPTFVPENLRGNRDSIRMWENPHWFLKWLADGCRLNPSGIYRCGSVTYDSNYEEIFYNVSLKPHPMFYCDRLEGCNWAMRTELIRKVGGFDPKFDGVSEWFDNDVEFKIKKLGYKLIYNPQAYLYHLLEKGEHYNDRFEGFGRIKNFLRFHWRHGRWRFLSFKFYVFLIVWIGYFILRRFKK